MKNLQTFEDFVNESWGQNVAKTSIEVDELFDTVANWWEENGDLEIHQTKQGEKIRNLAHDYFKKFRKINGRIIDAMISQEAI